MRKCKICGKPAADSILYCSECIKHMDYCNEICDPKGKNGTWDDCEKCKECGLELDGGNEELLYKCEICGNVIKGKFNSVFYSNGKEIVNVIENKNNGYKKNNVSKLLYNIGTYSICISSIINFFAASYISSELNSTFTGIVLFLMIELSTVILGSIPIGISEIIALLNDIKYK